MKRINKSSNSIIFLIMLIGLIFFYFTAIEYICSSFIALVNSLLLFMIGIFAIFICSFKLKYSFTLNGFIWLFIFFFCSIAPIMQLSSGGFPWNYKVSSLELFYTLILLIAWLVIYEVSYHMKSLFKLKINYMFDFSFSKRDGIFPDIILTLITICALLLCIKYYGFLNLFSRKIGAYNVTYNDGKGIPLLMGHVVRNFPLCICSIEIMRYRKFNLFVCISLICTILTKFPTGIGRFNLAVAYIGLLIIAFPSFFKKRKRFEIILSIGILYFFPLINIFRYVSLDEITISRILNSFEGIGSIFSSGDFDAFSIYVMTVENIDKNGPVFGAILGTLLFFIPRSIWPGKPVGSGTYIARMQGLEFDNLSCPIWAEGYLNGGVIGFIFTAIIFSRIVRNLDNCYWNKNTKKDEDNRFICLIYPFLLGYFFTMCRGALISCFAYTIGFVCTAFLCFLISHRIKFEKC